MNLQSKTCLKLLSILSISNSYYKLPSWARGCGHVNSLKSNDERGRSPEDRHSQDKYVMWRVGGDQELNVRNSIRSCRPITILR
jgi:hypothetical protein